MVVGGVSSYNKIYGAVPAVAKEPSEYHQTQLYNQ